MASIVEYLKRPELVVAVQEWFGVEYIDSADKSSDLQDLCDHSPTAKQYRFEVNSDYNKRNRVSEVNDKTLDSSTAKEYSKDDADRGYRITNKFWYYLFVFGTELGDEIFYATMIPFWLWNIDGAVGRRVVFLWSIVMYIGQSLKGKTDAFSSFRTFPYSKSTSRFFSSVL